MMPHLQAALFSGERIDMEYWPPGTTRKALALARDLGTYIRCRGEVADTLFRRIEAVPDLALALTILRTNNEWEWAQRACRSTHDTLLTLDRWMAAGAALRVAIKEGLEGDAGDPEDPAKEE